MDLFVVNRHLDVEVPEVGNEDVILKKTLERIERNRENRRAKKHRKTELKEKVIADKWDIINRRKRERDARIISVPENDNAFIDENIAEFAKQFEGEKTTEVEPEEKVENTENASKKRKKHEKIEGFTVLGVDSYKKSSAAKMALPDWLAKPTIISVDLQNLTTKASSLKTLDKDLRTKLKENGVKYLFPVQSQVIPEILKMQQLKHCMSPNDICVSAPTGSGKTLAYVLPIIQTLRAHFVKKIRALVILPTQDLAIQVQKAFVKYSQGTNLSVMMVTRGTPFLNEQRELIRDNGAFGLTSNVDILIGTAGRLVDHIKQTQGFSLEHLEFLVIDEADRVLENVQNDWLYHLERHIYGNTKDLNALNVSTYRGRHAPQKLLFSATLSQDPEKLHQLGLFQPKLFTSSEQNKKGDNEDSGQFIGKYTTPKELTEKTLLASVELKPLVLYQFIKEHDLSKTLVFVHSLDSAHRLKLLLRELFNSNVSGEQKKLNVQELGSKLTTALRNKLIAQFTSGQIDILICTDALARGIDLPLVKCVISYSAPKHLKTYIHRAGRTARAGVPGLAVTMLQPQQVGKFNEMLSQAEKTTLEQVTVDEACLEGLSAQYQEALAALKTTMHAEEVDKVKKRTSAKRLGA